MIYNSEFLKSLHAEKLAEARQARLVKLARRRPRTKSARWPAPSRVRVPGADARRRVL